MGWERDEGAPTSPPVHVQLKPHKRAVLQSKIATMSIETMGVALAGAGCRGRWGTRPLLCESTGVVQCLLSIFVSVSIHVKDHTPQALCAQPFCLG